MEKWLKISLLLCLYGFFREMKPSDPFIYEFLVGEWRNVTDQQLIEIVYPMATYYNCGFLLVVLIVTDMLRYKSVIIVSALAGSSYLGILLWTTSFEALYVLQFCFGLYLATEVAYYTYIYAKVERDRYQQVTSNSRSAILFGRFTGSVLGQVLIYFQWLDVRELNYISFSNQLISLIVAVLLPSVGSSLYFYNKSVSRTKEVEKVECFVISTALNGDVAKENLKIVNKSIVLETKNLKKSVDKKISDNQPKPVTEKKILNSFEIDRNEVTKGQFSCQNATSLLWVHFKSAYSNKTVLIWSIWYALAMGGFLMVFSYIQPLWHFIDPESNNLWNGAAEALLTLLGALGAMAAALINQESIEKWDILIISLCSAVQGGLLLITAFTASIYVSYGMYVAFGTLFHFMITISSAIIAKFLVEDSFAWIFGINTFMALLCQVLLTIIVSSGNVLRLNPREQFTAFGVFFLLLSSIYGLFGILKLALSQFNKNKNSFDVS